MVMPVSVSSGQLEFGPRISFSREFVDINSGRFELEGDNSGSSEFEFLAADSGESMLTADRLFFQGKLLPFSQIPCIQCTTMQNINFEPKKNEKEHEEIKVGLFLEGDPSPRAPKCSLLWKELLKFKKSQPPPPPSLVSLSPSPPKSSSLPSLLSSSSSSSLSGIRRPAEKKKLSNDFFSERFEVRSDYVKRTLKGLERSHSDGLRVRPVLNVSICSQGKNTGINSLFAYKK